MSSTTSVPWDYEAIGRTLHERCPEVSLDSLTRAYEQKEEWCELTGVPHKVPTDAHFFITVFTEEAINGKRRRIDVEVPEFPPEHALSQWIEAVIPNLLNAYRQVRVTGRDITLPDV